MRADLLALRRRELVPQPQPDIGLQSRMHRPLRWLPSHDGCFQFVVPNSVLGDDDTENGILQVKARIVIR